MGVVYLERGPHGQANETSSPLYERGLNRRCGGSCMSCISVGTCVFWCGPQNTCFLGVVSPRFLLCFCSPCLTPHPLSRVSQTYKTTPQPKATEAPTPTRWRQRNVERRSLRMIKLKQEKWRSLSCMQSPTHLPAVLWVSHCPACTALNCLQAVGQGTPYEIDFVARACFIWMRHACCGPFVSSPKFPPFSACMH